jgi:uncharacterized protein
MMHALTLVTKVTRRCNLRCTYCNDWRPGNAPIMSRPVLDSLLERAFADEQSAMTAFAWHGGEPTMVPLDFFEYAFARQRELGTSTGRLSANLLQTNAVSLSDGWLDLIERNGVRLGVSLDGPPDLHDKQRPNVAGRGSYRQVAKTLTRLRRRRIPFSTLMVLTDELIDLGPQALWDFLLEEGLDDVDLIPARPPNTTEHPTVHPQGVKFDPAVEHEDRWAAYMSELFDIYWSSPTPVRVNTLDSLVRKLLGASGRSCITSGDCMGHFFGVEPDGEVYVCGLYEDVSEFRLGSVLTHTFPQMRAAPGLTSVEETNSRRLAEQSSCPSFDLCAGGCPHDYFLSQQYKGSSEQQTCCGWAPFAEHVRSAVTSTSLPLRAEEGRKQASPAGAA